MSKGKDKCEFLRNIRRQVAAKYGLHYVPRECHHEGDCPGTCPVCDAELCDLQRQLKERGIENIEAFERVETNDRFEVNPDLSSGPGVPADYAEDCRPLEGDVIPPEKPEEICLEGMPQPPEIFGEPYRFCYVAGIMFHNINDIWNELYVGAKLALIRQPDNKYDQNAIEVALAGDYDADEHESFDFDFILGYIPRAENEELASMMDEGYQFVAEISELNRYAPYDKRLGITIIQNGINAKPSVRYRALRIDDNEFAMIQASLLKDGFIYQRWGGFSKRNIVSPIKGEKVVLIHKRESDAVLFLTTVAAVGSDAVIFIDEEINVEDDCCPVILLNSVGPLVEPNWSLDFLDKEEIHSMTPSRKFLSKSAQAKLTQIFTSLLK
jgi:hypothetical protein